MYRDRTLILQIQVLSEAGLSQTVNGIMEMPQMVHLIHITMRRQVFIM